MAKFRDKPIEGRRFRCKCGKIIIMDDRNLKTYHSIPLCKFYRDALKEIGGAQPEGIVVEPAKDD